MNLNDYLLTKLQEEYLEVAMVVSKAITFGPEDINPSNGLSNQLCYKRELIDVDVINFLVGELGLQSSFLRWQDPNYDYVGGEWDYFEWKVGKLIYFIFVSSRLGRVQLSESEIRKLRQIHETSKSAYASRGCICGDFLDIDDLMSGISATRLDVPPPDDADARLDKALAEIFPNQNNQLVMVATVQGSDPYDEREGLRLSIEDSERLKQLPKGTKLFAVVEGIKDDSILNHVVGTDDPIPGHPKDKLEILAKAPWKSYFRNVIFPSR